MENNIKIVRLKSGEDIIGNLAVVEDTINICEPMSVSVVDEGRQQGLVMAHWLPIQLIKKNEITIKSRDVLTVFDPNDEFAEYYENTVEKLKTILKTKEYVDSLDDEEINEVMESIIASKGQILH